MSLKIVVGILCLGIATVNPASAGGVSHKGYQRKTVSLGPREEPQIKDRLFQVNDLFQLEDVGEYYGGAFTFSPNGHSLAFTRLRPTKTVKKYNLGVVDNQFGLFDGARADVWVQLEAGEKPINVTDGAGDASGWWSSQWSPDGLRLAMLSTRGGEICLWVWDASKRTLQQATTHPIDLDNNVLRPYLWVDSDHLLYPALPEPGPPDRQPSELLSGELSVPSTPSKLFTEWNRTASVLDSGALVNAAHRKVPELFLVEISSKTERVVARGAARLFQLSPRGNAVAFSRQVAPYSPRSEELLSFDTGKWTIDVMTVGGNPVSFGGEVASNDVVRESVRWSPDGSEVAFLGYRAGRDEPPLLYRLNIRQRRVVSIELKGLNAVPGPSWESQLEWTVAGDLILLATRRFKDANPGSTHRRDWWLVGPDGGTKCLTASLAAPPSRIWPQDGREGFVWVGEGKIWRLDAATGKIGNLTASFEPRIESIAWPPETESAVQEYQSPDRAYPRLIFSVKQDEGLAHFLLDLTSEKITQIATPTDKADLVAYAPSSSALVLYKKDRNGLNAWRGDSRNGSYDKLFNANEFLRDVAQGEFKSLEYTSLDGQTLKAWLLLPPYYDSGKRYPLVAWVYAGDVFGSSPPRANINSSSSVNPQILAAKGYVVLFPSMPLGPWGTTDDPMLKLPNGVLPAVEKVIEMGIADPSRLGLIGQSFGGYSTYGLVTQTQRFKAAVSMAGLSDLVSLYGEFWVRYRYTDYPHEHLFMAQSMESGQVRMGNPPWKDLGRYIRNSPIFFVDRVQTPLMIIQGNLDHVAISQGEEFFSSLYRQGKPARFVRYWGEGHVIQIPENVRDMWYRIYAWFDGFLDISRDEQGNLKWDGEMVKSRAGEPPLKPDNFAHFDEHNLASTPR